MANYKYGIFTAFCEFMEYENRYYGVKNSYDRVPERKEAIAEDPTPFLREKFTTKEAALERLDQQYESYRYHYFTSSDNEFKIYQYRVRFVAELETGRVLKVADYPM